MSADFIDATIAYIKIQVERAVDAQLAPLDEQLGALHKATTENFAALERQLETIHRVDQDVSKKRIEDLEKDRDKSLDRLESRLNDKIQTLDRLVESSVQTCDAQTAYILRLEADIKRLDARNDNLVTRVDRLENQAADSAASSKVDGARLHWSFNELDERIGALEKQSAASAEALMMDGARINDIGKLQCVLESKFALLVKDTADSAEASRVESAGLSRSIGDAAERVDGIGARIDNIINSIHRMKDKFTYQDQYRDGVGKQIVAFAERVSLVENALCGANDKLTKRIDDVSLRIDGLHDTLTNRINAVVDEIDNPRRRG